MPRLRAIICTLIIAGTFYNNHYCLADHRCELSNLELKTFVKSKNVTVIDTRPPNEFSQLYTGNALNLPLFSIKTKSYLKSTPLLLIAAPYEVRNLEETCQELLKLGFENVKTLPNGIRRWKNAGGELIGNSVDLSRSFLVTSQQILSALTYKDWHIVDLSKSQDHPLQICSITVTPVPFSNSPTILAKTLRAALVNFKVSPENLWVAIMTETADPQKEEMLLAAVGGLSDLGNIFIVSGGRSGLNDLIARDEKVRAQLNESKKIKQCGK